MSQIKPTSDYQWQVFKATVGFRQMTQGEIMSREGNTDFAMFLQATRRNYVSSIIFEHEDQWDT